MLLLSGAEVSADPPVASYLFPAGGRRGTTVALRVGGLNLHSRCGFELLGAGVVTDPLLKRQPTLWFEGPLLPLPESQQQEDYPQDMSSKVRIAANAMLGLRIGRLWSAQGASSGLAFVVGDLSEIVESESSGLHEAVRVTLPVTVNGRIFPREDVDEWAFAARKGQTITATALAGRLGFPLLPHLEIIDSANRKRAENDPYPGAADARVTFAVPADGDYRIRIRDARFLGGQNYIYRLTISTDVPRLEEDTPNIGQPSAIPAEVQGHIRVPGQVDGWNVALKNGLAYDLRVMAQRIDSPLRAVLSIRDAGGKELARADAVTANGDPSLRFTPPADGVYRVQVGDAFATVVGRPLPID